MIIGCGPETKTTKAIAGLAGKENPKILLIPTAKQDAAGKRGRTEYNYQ